MFKPSIIQRLVPGLALLVILSGCEVFFGPGPGLDGFSNPDQEAPVSAIKPYPYPDPQPVVDQAVNPPVQADPEPQDNSVVNSEPLADPQPEADPEPEAPDGPAIQLVWFEESDCALPGLPGLEAGYGPGVLRCEYRWSGKYIDDNNALIEIYELPDSEELSRQFEEGMNNAHIDADDKQDDQMLSIIRNDENGIIFIFTNPGGGSSKTNTEIPQCGRGNGVEKIDDRFLVQVRLFSCDISEGAIEYVRTLEAMKAIAEAAITRALNVDNP